MTISIKQADLRFYPHLDYLPHKSIPLANAQPAKINCAVPINTPMILATRNGKKGIFRLPAIKGVNFDTGPEILASTNVRAPLR